MAIVVGSRQTVIANGNAGGLIEGGQTLQIGQDMILRTEDQHVRRPRPAGRPILPADVLVPGVPSGRVASNFGASSGRAAQSWGSERGRYRSFGACGSAGSQERVRSGLGARTGLRRCAVIALLIDGVGY